jgi:hypothetical protein
MEKGRLRHWRRAHARSAGGCVSLNARSNFKKAPFLAVVA